MTDPTTGAAKPDLRVPALAAAREAIETAVHPFTCEYDAHRPGDSGWPDNFRCDRATTKVLAALSGYTLVKDEELERLRRIEAAAQAYNDYGTVLPPDDWNPTEEEGRVYAKAWSDGLTEARHALRAALTPESSNAK